MLTKISAPSTPHGGPPPSCQAGAARRRTPLRSVRPGGFVQVLRRPLARWCTDLRHDERGVLLWALIEANRQHWGRPGTPVLTVSKKGLAEHLGIERRRAARILERLDEVGAIAWTPGARGLDGEMEILIYDEVVANGRRGRGTNYCAMLCGPVDDALDELGFDAWAVLALAAIEVGSVTQTIAGPAPGIAAHLGLSWYRLRPIIKMLATTGRIEWIRSATGARLRLLSYVDLVAAGRATGDLGEVRIDSAGQVLGCEEAAQIPPRRPRKSATDYLENPPRPHAKSATPPAVPPPSLEGQLEDPLEPPLPPSPPECSTPAEPTTKTRGGQGQHLRRVLIDREATMAVLNELAAYLDDPRGYGAALRVDFLGDTAKAWELAGAIDDRLDAGWEPDQLADRLTDNLPDEFSNGSPTRLLAWRAADLPLQAPEEPEVTEITDEPLDTEPQVATVVVRPEEPDPPAWELLDDGTARRPEAPTALPPAPGADRKVIDVDPGADEATDPLPGTLPAGCGPEWARQAPPPAIEGPPTGDRTPEALDNAYSGPEPSEAPPDLAAALAALLRRPPADHEPRRTVERPGPVAPMTPEQRAERNREAARLREAKAARLRPYGLSA